MARSCCSQGLRAFSLLEMLVAMAVLAVLTTLSLGLISSSSAIWQNARSKIEMFQDARIAFETLTRKLSQATMNTFWDYHLDSNGKPERYLRESDLNFCSGSALVPEIFGHAVFFQTPTSVAIDEDLQGLGGLLNAVGYYVSYEQRDANAPDFITNRSSFSPEWRYMLHEVIAPTENLEVYNQSEGDQAWIEAARSHGLTRPLAENIIALVVWPRLSEAEDPEGLELAPNFEYDSRRSAASVPQPRTAHQLPPTIQITMIAVDEASIQRMGFGDSSTPPLEISNLLEGRFSRAADFTEDLNAVTQGLSGIGINHRVFSETVPLRESKWSD